jgi:hypothetical protein
MAEVRLVPAGTPAAVVTKPNAMAPTASAFERAAAVEMEPSTRPAALVELECCGTVRSENVSGPREMVQGPDAKSKRH